MPALPLATLPASPTDRVRLVRRSSRLTALTVGYNLLEGVISLVAGALAGSVSLIGFGIDSGIEVLASITALWRLGRDGEPVARAAAERRALRIIAVSFFGLGAWVSWDAAATLLSRSAPDRSPVGIGLALASLVVMPLLARAKRRVALSLGSQALVAEARQTSLCTWLSAILLGGLLLNQLLGWWWADPLAALVMVPLILKEGREAWRGHLCCDHCQP
ncbi:MAG: cation transporter [Gemmatimonadetes bacterium]|nr:cation transporter [Gemmatimonadota bacterium]MBP6668100.1 cation transporter [Gemmatimonadales bacterium]MBK7348420.1 cation transporter [Gemmatimonadota bacterium]MBK7713990.1 cation transporter [Gemmatimonadota bacterium]MBK7783045.1 cation transporter [Gemmatimonadota bacterium]